MGRGITGEEERGVMLEEHSKRQEKTQRVH